MNGSPLVDPETLVSEFRSQSRFSPSRRYPREFRRDVARLICDGQTDAGSMSIALGVKARTIDRWVSEVREVRMRSASEKR